MFKNCKIGKKDVKGTDIREGMNVRFKLIHFYGNVWVRGKVIYKEDICSFVIEVSAQDAQRSTSIPLNDDYWRFDTQFDFIEVLN